MRTAWVVAAIACGATSASAQAPHISQGEAALRYETYCRACHTEQVHWRDGRLARDWPSLVREVRRWQANLNLGWTDEDIRQVAHYLNLRYYRFRPAPPKVIVEAQR